MMWPKEDWRLSSKNRLRNDQCMHILHWAHSTAFLFSASSQFFNPFFSLHYISACFSLRFISFYIVNFCDYFYHHTERGERKFQLKLRRTSHNSGSRRKNILFTFPFLKQILRHIVGWNSFCIIRLCLNKVEFIISSSFFLFDNPQ
jgi:hypothetical protein